MNETVIPASALGDYIPHRGANLIPDQVILAEDMRSARSHTHIPLGDSRGREIFHRHGADGRRYWNEPFLAELLALTGIPLLAKQLADDNKVAVFSAISKIECLAPVPFHEEVIGYTEITRQRTGFAQFATHLEYQGERVLSAEIMSGSAHMADILGNVSSDQPPLAEGEALDEWSWKPASMRFIDRVIHSGPSADSADSADGKPPSLQAGYRYPLDHPFVPGHFPDGPLMMGVTQWLAMGDALWALLQRQGAGDGRYTAQGNLSRPDGSEVVSARDLCLEISEGFPRLCGLKRIMFREVVRPGDELLINVQLDS